MPKPMWILIQLLYNGLRPTLSAHQAWYIYTLVVQRRWVRTHKAVALMLWLNILFSKKYSIQYFAPPLRRGSFFVMGFILLNKLIIV
jgi:hypothetical protein